MISPEKFSQLRVGDRLRVTTQKDIIAMTPKMYELSGEVVTVSKKVTSGVIRILEDNEAFVWNHTMFSEVLEIEREIVAHTENQVDDLLFA